MSKWISVELTGKPNKDRLPKSSDYKEFWINDRYEEGVLVTDGDIITIGRCIETYSYPEMWVDINGDRIEGVTHWMPLPEPPVEKTKEELEIEMWSLMS